MNNVDMMNFKLLGLKGLKGLVLKVFAFYSLGVKVDVNQKCLFCLIVVLLGIL